MSSAAIAPRRNPKRARTNAVSYKENTEEDDDQLIDDDEIVWQYEDVDFDAAQSTPEPKKKYFDFMELPLEIRLMIVKLAVADPENVVYLEPQNITKGRLRRWLVFSFNMNRHRTNYIAAGAAFSHQRRYRNCNLILASKEIYEYAMPVMYTKQKFVFTRLCALQTFLLPMRPQTLDLLRHVEVTVRHDEWNMMPAIAALLVKLRFLKTLVINGICEVTSVRCVGKYLEATNRSLSNASLWPVTQETYDKIQGIKLARDTYPFLYPLFNPIVRAQLAATAANDVAEAVEAAEIGEIDEVDEIAEVDEMDEVDGVAEVIEEDEVAEVIEVADPRLVALASSTSASVPSEPKELSTVTYKKAEISLEDKPAPKPIANVQELMQVMRFTESENRNGWYGRFSSPPRWTWFKTLTFSYTLGNFGLARFTPAPKDDEQRQSTIMTAMGEELVRLVVQDTY